jgi:hypothetical protein
MFRVNINNIISDDFIKKLRDSQSEILKKSLSPLLKEIREEYALGQTEEFKKFLETIEQEASEIPPYVNKVHSYFAELGWFVPFYSSSLHIFKEYAKLIDLEKHELIEDNIRNYIRGKLPEIGKNIEEVFPDRHKIIKTALDAHKDENYILAIPTLLAQADGMFSDLLDKTFYTNAAHKLEDIRRRLLTKFAENGHPPSTSSLGFLLIKQLQEKSIIHESFGDFERKLDSNSESDPLNRHYILHGKSLKYDTEENSLKAISLIGLLCDCRKTFTI